MNPFLDPDRALVQACQRSDEPSWEDAFRLLHDRHRSAVLAICLRITGDVNDALDAAQEVFLLAFRGIGGFRFHSRFSRWLCRIAVHVSFEHKRRRRAPRSFSEFDELELGWEPRADPRLSAERRERRERVHRALRQLSPRMRQILVLRYFAELSYEELAARLSIANGSVKSRLHRAHEALEKRVLSLVDEV